MKDYYADLQKQNIDQKLDPLEHFDWLLMMSDSVNKFIPGIQYKTELRGNS